MKEIKKILDVMAVPEERTVSLAFFMLRDEVDNWCDMIKTNEQMRAEQFQEGLRLNIRAQVAPFMLCTYSEVVARALVREGEMEEAQRLRSKNSRDQGDAMNPVRWDILGGIAQNFNDLLTSHLNGNFSR
ncbi:hypothetical protein CK203_065135 [Vitis vinifera]|uniref:Uncharacterized protein n=1 Tax=Vitis vinifera TaxID=29760 RepID=A0A438GEI2_VITVI|nr:hypothetical protein CK203_065135 [Vitis vinifera]